MDISSLEIIITALIIAWSATLPGVYLALQRKALLADAATHSVLLGIIIGYLILTSFASSLLLIFAVLTAMSALLLAEVLTQHILFLKADAAMVISFSLSFSLAIIIINLSSAKNIHLDEDVVLLGDLAFTPFLRVQITEKFSLSIALVRSGIIFFITLILTLFLYRKFALVSFDPILASTQGIPPRSLNLLLTIIACINAVNAIEYTGILIAIAFFALPASTSLLFPHKTLASVFLVSYLLATITIPLGYLSAYFLNTSIGGSIALSMGSAFLLIAVFNALRYRNKFHHTTDQ